MAIVTAIRLWTAENNARSVHESDTKNLFHQHQRQHVDAGSGAKKTILLFSGSHRVFLSAHSVL